VSYSYSRVKYVINVFSVTVLTASSGWRAGTHSWRDCYAWWDASSSASSVRVRQLCIHMRIERES